MHADRQAVAQFRRVAGARFVRSGAVDGDGPDADTSCQGGRFRRPHHHVRTVASGADAHSAPPWPPDRSTGSPVDPARTRLRSKCRASAAAASRSDASPRALIVTGPTSAGRPAGRVRYPRGRPRNRRLQPQRGHTVLQIRHRIGGRPGAIGICDATDRMSQPDSERWATGARGAGQDVRARPTLAGVPRGGIRTPSTVLRASMFHAVSSAPSAASRPGPAEYRSGGAIPVLLGDGCPCGQSDRTAVVEVHQPILGRSCSSSGVFRRRPVTSLVYRVPLNGTRYHYRLARLNVQAT